MAVATFDTLKYANTLKAGGVPAPQAEAQAVALGEAVQVNFKELATKDDLAAAVKDVKHEVKEVEQRLNAKIDNAVAKLDAKFDNAVAKLDAKIDGVAAKVDAKIDGVAAKLDTKIEVAITQHRADMTRITWMFSVILAVGVGILVRSFFYHVGP